MNNKYKYVVFTEIHEGGKVERWFYGADNILSRAAEEACIAGYNPSEHYWHSVCLAEEVEKYGIKNIPDDFYA